MNLRKLLLQFLQFNKAAFALFDEDISGESRLYLQSNAGRAIKKTVQIGEWEFFLPLFLFNCTVSSASECINVCEAKRSAAHDRPVSGKIFLYSFQLFIRPIPTESLPRSFHSRILLTISLKIDFKSLPATLNECGSIASGAPITTSGAPCFGIEIASSIERPPTACTGTLTASTTAFRSSSGLRRLPVSAKMPFRSSKPV